MELSQALPLAEMYLEAEKQLVIAFEKRVVDRKFNRDVANQLLLELYWPHIEEAREVSSRSLL